MSGIFTWLDRGVEILARGIRWLALAMVLVTLVVVVLRYVFNVGAIPLQEAVMYMHGVLFLLGIPYGLRQGTHVRVDIFYARQAGNVGEFNQWRHLVVVPTANFGVCR